MITAVKVFITATPVTTATRFLPPIMKAIVNMPDDCKRHCRLKTKFLLERLSRKFGYDLVASLVPKSDVTTQKRLRNIKKEGARKARKVSEDGSGADEDEFGAKGRQKTMDEMLADSSDDEFDEKEEATATTKRGKGKGTWIQEGEEILDLLSSTAAQNISSTRPGQPRDQVVEKRKTKSKDFKMTADGRIIVTDKVGSDGEEEGGRANRRDR